MKTCSVEGCNKKIAGRGLCSTHYSQARKRGDFGQVKKTCSIDGCDKPVHAKGLCSAHYYKLTKVPPSKKVADLSGEEWREIVGHDGLLVSNMGRVKSIRTRHEQLIKQRFVIPTGAKQPCLLANKVVVATEVLKAFAPSDWQEDRQVVFKDGDRHNCKLENLQWFGCGLLDKAIAAAEKSDSEWADCFLKFWHGDNAALDLFWVNIKPRIAGFIRGKAERAGLGWIDMDGYVQEAMVQVFISIKRGMVQSIDNIVGWVLSIAEKTLIKKTKNWWLAKPMEMEGYGEKDDGLTWADITGFCYPSAELEALYNMEVVCA